MIVAHRPFDRIRLQMSLEHKGLGMTVLPDRFTSQPIDGPISSCGDDPPSWVGGQAGLRPSLGGHHEGLLNRLLGDIDVMKEADQGGYSLAGFLPEDQVDGGDCGAG